MPEKRTMIIHQRHDMALSYVYSSGINECVNDCGDDELVSNAQWRLFGPCSCEQVGGGGWLSRKRRQKRPRRTTNHRQGIDTFPTTKVGAWSLSWRLKWFRSQRLELKTPMTRRWASNRVINRESVNKSCLHVAAYSIQTPVAPRRYKLATHFCNLTVIMNNGH